VLDHLSCFLEASFVLFKQVTICHVMSTTCPRDAAPMQEGGDAVAERDAIDEGRNSASSVERSESVHRSDVGSQSNAEGDSDGGSHTRSYYFGTLMVTVSHIREMMERAYFVEGGG
jgi:hypothetical protein